MEGLVEIAAFGALDAGGTPVLARALADHTSGIGHEPVELIEATLGDPNAAWVAVVDEDRRQPGLEVDVRREPADVPPVAHRQQRQHRYLAVLGRMQGTEEDL